MRTVVRRVAIHTLIVSTAVVGLFAVTVWAATFTVSPSIQAFENQIVNTASVPRTITVTNNARNALVFTTTLTGDFFINSTTCNGMVLPGSTCGISLAFRPTALGARTGTIVITDAAKASNKQTVTLSGTGVLATTVTPTSLAFGNVTRNTVSAGKTVTLVNNQDAPLTGIAFASSNSDYSITSSCLASLAPRSSCDASITFGPTQPPGTIENATLFISHSAGTSPDTVSLTGTSASAPVVVSPNPLDFGSATVGSTTTGRIVTIANAATGPLTFANPLATIAGTFGADYAQTSTTCGKKLNAGANCTVTLTFHPTVGGARPATLAINDNASGSPQVIALAGVGTTPMTVTPSTLNYAGVDVSVASAAQFVTVTNKQSGPVTLNSITTTGDFATQANGTTCGSSLAAGAACVVAVVMTPTAGGPRTGTLVIASNTSETPNTVTLSGLGTKPMTVTPSTLNYGGVDVSASSTAQLVTVTNKQSVAVTLSSITATGDFVTQAGGTTCGSSLSAGAACMVAVVMTPTVGGPRTGTLVIASNTSESPNTVTLSGIGTKPLVVTPPTLDFGGVDVSFPSTAQLVTVTNKQSAAVTLNSITTTGDFATQITGTTCATSLAAGASCTVAVAMTPTVGGPRTGTLVITSDASESPNTIALTGIGTKPVIVTPNPLNFGNVTVASTSAGSVVTITNKQAIQVTFGAPLITLGGTASADYAQASTTCQSTLNANASCTITLTFHPTVGGARPATLAVNDNAYASPRTIALAGTGTTPITITPSSVAFGSSDVGVPSSAQLVTLKNNQSIPVSFNSVTTTGDFGVPGAGTTCATTLAADSSCVVAVVMAPTIGGPRTGTLKIDTNTSESPNTVTLSGVGANAVTASAASLTFAGQPVNTTSAAQLIALTNHQTVPAPLGTGVTGDFAASDACAGVIPAGSSCSVSITFTPTVLGTRNGAATFDNPGSSPISISLSGAGITATPPAVVSVVPGAGTLGTSVTGVVITANGFTHFSSSSVVSVGGGIAVSNPRNVTANALTVDLSIASAATPGSRVVTVTTPLSGGGNETAVLDPGFAVATSAALSLLSVTPTSAKQGQQALDVAVVGDATHFQQGVTFANFGQGVTVTLTIQDQTHATATVSVSPTATLGWRSVTLATGGEQASLSPIPPNGPGFNVVAGDGALTQVSPNSGDQGANPFVVTVTGSATHFLQGATQVSFGTGINVSNVQVLSLTQLTASVAVPVAAVVGQRDVTATTGGEVATIANGFSVTPAASPTLSNVTPNEGHQGETVSLTLTGLNTHFTTALPAPALDLGSTITVSSLVVVNDTTITADAAVGALAVVGARSATLSSGGTNFPFTFTVLPSNATIGSVSPGNAPQGQTISVTVTGQNTHWLQGTTTATFAPQPCPVAIVQRVTVNDPTSVVLDLQIPDNACVGAEAFQIATAGEIVGSTFGVYQQTPSIVLSPSNAMPGTTLTVNIIGEFSHFADPSTQAVIDGTGVTIQNFVVSNPAKATATFTIATDALPGRHVVTLTTPLGGGASEILTTSFQVTSTAAVLTAIEPSHAAPGAMTTVTIRGSLTHFADGQTTVGFGPDISTDTLTVVSPTELTVNVSVDAAAALGWRSAHVNTGAEQLTIGFHVDGPAAPGIIAVSPSSGAQGQTLSVAITGANTNFNQTSQLILGAGVVVNNFQVTSRTTADATVTISPTAPVGPNSIFVFTDLGSNQEIASGAGFSVVRGPSQILSATPSIAAQNQVLNITLVGQGTHWLQGGTTADFGPGVVVGQLTIANPTHASAQILVVSTAVLGFHTVAMLTDGEYVELTQGLDVQQGTPMLVSSSPNTGAQATTFNVQVLGQLTHWQQGQTTASYGAGVTVNSFTIVDSVSGIINVTVDPLAFVDPAPSCHSLTITTGFEQVSLPNQLCVVSGAATVTSISPNAAPQGSTLTVNVTGQNTHFTPGLTTASFGQGINASNVTVTGPTTASVDLAVTSNATTGFRTATLQTQGETASLANAFNVGPNTPTLNGASPVAAQQGQSLTVHLIGQYTHWTQGATTVTFGEGITVGTVTVVDAATLDAALTVNPIALLGARTVTVTTGGEIVSANVFGVVAGSAIVSQVGPQSGNQGQDIVLTITGQNTHWQQGFTQFSMAGAGGDIKINYVLIDSETSATAGITISPTANLGARSIYMVTGAEALVDANAFIVTGGIPAVGSVAPGSARAGETVSVEIAGLYTHWLSGTTTVDFGPGVAVSAFTVNSDTSLTAVLDVAAAAGLGGRTVTVRNVANNAAQVLTGFFQVVSNAPPTPVISYMSPTSGLRGQTFTISFSGLNTHWDLTPNATRIGFGDPLSGIAVNSFQVLGPTSARANITIAPNAAFGAVTVTIAADLQGGGTEVVQAPFSVVQETPTLTIVDPASGMQGATVTVNVLGQFTGFNDTTTFNFGTGVTVDNVIVLGPTIAQVQLSIGQLALQGGRFVTATTDGKLVGGGGFSVTPSQAVVVSLSPNTAKQQDTIIANVIGQNTSWDGTTTFSLGGGVDVTNVIVGDSTHATLTIAVQPLAALGARSIVATTQGEVASLGNAFIVQPGTPLILSSGPSSAPQQDNVTFTILGQSTHWATGATSVDFGAGVIITSVNVTTETSITASAVVDWSALLGYRTLSVTTGTEVLALPNAFLITPGPAAIAQLSPAQAGQGLTLDVDVTGVNTHFMPGITQATFGAGVRTNAVTVHSSMSATVNITTAVNATPGQRSVTLTTLGESASIVNGFIVQLTTPSIQFVNPPAAAQAATLDVTVTGSVTNFNATTSFDFGPDVLVNSKSITSATQATVNISISPVAARTTRNVSATTGGVTATGANLFTVGAGPAYVSAVNPTSGRQDQSGLQVTISGFATHFTAATPTVSLGSGVTVTGLAVISDTQLTVTANISLNAPVQFNDVVVTTLGEVATLPAGFAVQPIVPLVPVITWNTPAAITYGTALSAIQLNATANVPGTFVYTPALGAHLHTGTGQVLSVQFTPADTIRYTNTTATVSIDVNRAGLQVTPDDQSKIVGTQNPPLTYTLGGFVLGDTALVVSGTPVLTTTAVTASAVGAYPISAALGTLTAADYVFAFGSGTLTVSPAGGSILAQHIENRDPLTEDFLDRGGITLDGPVTGDNGFDAWQVSGSGCCSYFYHPVDTTAAFGQGWRLTTRVRVVSGAGTAYATLNPAAGQMRFDVAVATQGQDTIFSLPGSNLSYVVPGAANQWIQFDLVYDPSTTSATLFVNGVQRLKGYMGWAFAQENRGVMFGADGVTANFNLVRFEIGTDVIDFEDQPASIAFDSPFASSYRGITWTNWRHYAPYGAPYQPDGVHAIYAHADGAKLTFSERAFFGAQFSRAPQATGDIYFELYHAGSVVWTSAPLSDAAPERTFLPSGYTGLVDEIHVRSLGASITGLGAAWVMDDLVFGRAQTKATPVISWPSPAPITFGTPLSATQLNATANVSGVFDYTPSTGSMLQAGVGQLLSTSFTPDDTLHYQNANATVTIDVAKANQLALVVTGAPSTAENASHFTVGATGGSGTGAVTFAATDACSNIAGGALITMTSGSGICSITATKAGDNNYFPTSTTVFVTATEAVVAKVKIANTLVGLAKGFTGFVTVRLLGGVDGSGGPVPAPSGGVSLVVTSSAPDCVVVSDALFPAGALSTAIPVSAGTAALPCDATVTITTSNFGNDSVPARVFPAEASYNGLTAVSYYNPAPIPDANGALRTRVSAVSYYNPASVPNPGGHVQSSVTALSFYNPAPLPDPNGALKTRLAALSYYNPAQVPNSGGVVQSGVAAISYYNPATVPNPGGIVATGIAAISYCNPDGSAPQSGQSQPTLQLAASTSGSQQIPAATTSSISLANGPTANAVDPVRLSRNAPTQVILTIYGVNLTRATGVRFMGLEQDVSMGGIIVSPDGRSMTVDVYVLPSAPLGRVSVVVTGPGWSTLEVPGMQVEIVP
jgi:MBG domain (YGX type)/Cep192 domain 4